MKFFFKEIINYYNLYNNKIISSLRGAGCNDHHRLVDMVLDVNHSYHIFNGGYLSNLITYLIYCIACCIFLYVIWYFDCSKILFKLEIWLVFNILYLIIFYSTHTNSLEIMWDAIIICKILILKCRYYSTELDDSTKKTVLLSVKVLASLIILIRLNYLDEPVRSVYGVYPAPTVSSTFNFAYIIFVSTYLFFILFGFFTASRFNYTRNNFIVTTITLFIMGLFFSYVNFSNLKVSHTPTFITIQIIIFIIITIIFLFYHPSQSNHERLDKISVVMIFMMCNVFTYIFFSLTITSFWKVFFIFAICIVIVIEYLYFYLKYRF